MKIKKTYTRCRVALFIGLLSFHTLSSCVHTAQQLGMESGPYNSNEEKPSFVREYEKDMQSFYGGSPTYKAGSSCKKNCLWMGIATILGVGIIILKTATGAYVLSTSQLTPSLLRNATISPKEIASSVPIGQSGANPLNNNFGLIPNMTLEDAELITQSIKKLEEQLGNGGNDSSSVTTPMPSLSINSDTNTTRTRIVVFFETGEAPKLMRYKNLYFNKAHAPKLFPYFVDKVKGPQGIPNNLKFYWSNNATAGWVPIGQLGASGLSDNFVPTSNTTLEDPPFINQPIKKVAKQPSNGANDNSSVATSIPSS